MGINTTPYVYGYNNSYNPYQVQGQQIPQIKGSKLAFGNVPQTDMFVSQYGQPKEEKGLFSKPSTWLALGVIGLVAFGCRKGGWVRNLWSKLGGKAGQEAAEAAANGTSEAAKKLALQNVPKHQQLQIQGLLTKRQDSFKNVEKLLAQDGITLTSEQFNKLKGCTTPDAVKTAVQGLFKADSNEGKAIAKLFADNDTASIINKWAQATSDYNVIKNPVRELAKKVDVSTLKAIRNADLAKIRGGEVQKLIDASPDKAKIYQLVNEGKTDEALKIINDFAKTNDGKAIIGSGAFTDLAKADVATWVKSSTDAAKVNPEKLSVILSDKVNNAEQAYKAITENWSADALAKFEAALGEGKSVNEALALAKKVSHNHIPNNLNWGNVFNPISA